MVKRTAKKDPEKPKRYMSAFLLYLNDFRKKNRTKNYTNVEMTRRGASGWRNLTNREKFPYEERSLKLKDKYTKDMEKYKQRVKWTPRTDRTDFNKAKKDPNKPKKALSAYMLFMKDFRQQNAECGWDFMEMVMKGATAWNLLSLAEKGPYEQSARKHAEKYHKQLADYKKNQQKELTKQKKEKEKQKELAKQLKVLTKEKNALAKQKPAKKTIKTSKQNSKTKRAIARVVKPKSKVQKTGPSSSRPKASTTKRKNR